MTQLNLYDATRSRTHPPRLQIQRSTSELQELVRHKNNLKHSVYLTPHEHIVNICEGMCSQSSDTWDNKNWKSNEGNYFGLRSRKELDL